MDTELTPEQEILIKQVRDEYLERFFAFTPLTQEQIRPAYEKLYELAGLRKPMVILLDNPWLCQVGANLDWPWENKRFAKNDEEYNQRLEIVRKMIEERKNKKPKQYEAFAWYGDCSDAYWVAFYDFHTRIGKINDAEFNEYLKIFKNFGFLTIQMDECCFVSQMPEYISRDNQQRFHSINKPAIVWKGYELYYVHGIRFTKNEFEQYMLGTPTWAELNGIANVEMRTAILMERLDYILENDKSVKVIDEDTEEIPVYEDDQVRNFQEMDEIIDRLKEDMDALESEPSRPKKRTKKSTTAKKAPELPTTPDLRKQIGVKSIKMILYKFDYLNTRQHALLLYDHTTLKPNVHLVPTDKVTCKDALLWFNKGWGITYKVVA